MAIMDRDVTGTTAAPTTAELEGRIASLEHTVEQQGIRIVSLEHTVEGQGITIAHLRRAMRVSGAALLAAGQ